MNQQYVSAAINSASETSNSRPIPHGSFNPVLHYNPNTFPGSRLPHVWLNSAVPSKLISTIDLAGHGAFVLFTGTGGAGWKEGARFAAAELRIEVKAWAIGWRQDYEDAYYDWTRLRGVEEDGCVLVRPDRFVAWRSVGMMDNCGKVLTGVLKGLLGRE